MFFFLTSKKLTKYEKKELSLKAKQQKREETIQLIKATLKTITEAAAAISHAHPISLALIFGTSAQIGHIVVGKPTQENAWIRTNIDGIYNLAMTLGGLAGAVPIVAGSLNLVGSYLAGKGGS